MYLVYLVNLVYSFDMSSNIDRGIAFADGIIFDKWSESASITNIVQYV